MLVWLYPFLILRFSFLAIGVHLSSQESAEYDPIGSVVSVEDSPHEEVTDEEDRTADTVDETLEEWRRIYESYREDKREFLNKLIAEGRKFRDFVRTQLPNGQRKPNHEESVEGFRKPVDVINKISPQNKEHVDNMPLREFKLVDGRITGNQEITIFKDGRYVGMLFEDAEEITDVDLIED